MRKFAIALSEVQDDIVRTDANIADTLVEAQNETRAFLKELVGNFLDIDPEDKAVRDKERAEAVERNLLVDTSEYRGLYTEHLIWRVDGPYGLCVSATIQEVEI